ncbi:hypothetical protein H6P81_005559 [Aristolochia fimbriata]|uniref:Uncharacterized protein n=1 Tax=Aristolochia fimbriata TaxID=158543 RepID=A0AAV7EUT2_ARIFI|nr:hypothetical protein H6P81_005559 [Aristolochia fimbriata]
MMEGMKSYIHSLHLGTPVEMYRISNSIYHRDEITYTTFLPQWILKIMLAWKEENEEKIPASTSLRDCLRRQNNRQRRLSSVKEETAKETQLRFQVGRGNRGGEADTAVYKNLTTAPIRSISSSHRPDLSARVIDPVYQPESSIRPISPSHRSGLSARVIDPAYQPESSIRPISPSHRSGVSARVTDRVYQPSHRSGLSARVTDRVYQPESPIGSIIPSHRSGLSARVTDPSISPSHRSGLSARVTDPVYQPESPMHLSARVTYPV